MNRYAVYTLMLVTLALVASLVLMVSATKSDAAEPDCSVVVTAPVTDNRK